MTPSVAWTVKRVHQITGAEQWWGGDSWVVSWHARWLFDKRPAGYWGSAQHFTSIIRITRTVRPRAIRVGDEVTIDGRDVGTVTAIYDSTADIVGRLGTRSTWETSALTLAPRQRGGKKKGA